VLGGRLYPLTRAAALGALARQPLLTLGVVVRIHWQALRLFIKHVPFYGKHPAPGRAAHVPDALHEAGLEADSEAAFEANHAHHSSSIEEIQP
jgi:DUF1365 family protein